MTEYQKGDKVRARVWREATVIQDSGPKSGSTGLVSVQAEGSPHPEYVTVPRDVQLIKRARPPLPPIGALVLGSPHMQLYRHDGPGTKWGVLAFTLVDGGTHASWDTICTGPGYEPITPQVYIPYNPTPVVAAYIDKDGDLWQPEGGGSSVLFLERPDGGKCENEQTYVEQHYGPLTPLVIDPTYKEPKE